LEKEDACGIGLKAHEGQGLSGEKEIAEGEGGKEYGEDIDRELNPLTQGVPPGVNLF